KNIVVHLGEKTDTWSQRALENAETALEHLGAFARPLGVRILVENLLNEPTTPEHLMLILEMGHLHQAGLCLDLGHAHMMEGVAQALATMGPRIASVHVHDNHGVKDEHLWPGEGTIDWAATMQGIRALPEPPAMVLELDSKFGEAHSGLDERIRQAFDKLE
ncbi:MAG: TIM barrel protein, partial [Terracidiphilus sp.]